MPPFNAYARYYDLLYRDKDYRAEAAFVDTLLQRHRPGTAAVLELGCGTGLHAVHLAEHGYTVHGVDLSPTMLAGAAARRADLPPPLAAKLSFGHGDLRSVRTGGVYDAVISLFHVMSYQLTNADLHAACATARAHLKPGGIFLFDFWYGPAVLTDPPTVRVKRMEDDQIAVTRIAEPTLWLNENRVDVHYTVFIKDKQSDAVDEVTETHHMRYLFMPEVDMLLAQHDLSKVAAGEWMTDHDPGVATWGTYIVGQL